MSERDNYRSNQCKLEILASELANETLPRVTNRNQRHYLLARESSERDTTNENRKYMLFKFVKYSMRDITGQN